MENKILFNRLLIFDLSHALHRSISEPHLWEMRNSKGEKTGGIYGTLQTILKESTSYNYFPVGVFDGHLSKRRLALYSNYKKAEERQLLTESKEVLTDIELLQQEQRREYNRQREILKELLPQFGIPVLHLADWEGDDIIYILSKLAKDSIIVSDDKDMIQLIYEDDTRRCRVRRGMRDEFLDNNWFVENNMTRTEFVARKAICGDTSDNIPSACFGVGEKTALGLYKLYTESQLMIGGFPKNEDELNQKCKDLGLTKRTAYLNFDENQYNINMALMDLFLVDGEISPELIDTINFDVLNDFNKINIEKINTILTDLEIKTFRVDKLLENVQRNSVTFNSFDSSVLEEIDKKPLIGKLF